MDSNLRTPGSEHLERKPVISPSSLDTYLKCGEQWRRRYVDKERIPPTAAQLAGRAVHKGSEVNFRQKIESSKDLKKPRIIEAAVSSFEDTVKHETVSLLPEEKTVGKKKVLGQAKDRVVSLSGVYADNVAPDWQPSAVEITQRILLPNAPRDLLGILDMTGKVISHKKLSDKLKPLVNGRGEVIVDFKSGKRTTTQDDVDGSTQFTFYALTYKALHKTEPPPVVVENLVDTKEPKRVTLTTTRGKEDFQALINKVNTFLKGVSAGVFLPAPTGAWWCSGRWCQFHATCPYVNGKR